jgi:hypothetical protein
MAGQQLIGGRLSGLVASKQLLPSRHQYMHALRQYQATSYSNTYQACRSRTVSRSRRSICAQTKQEARLIAKSNGPETGQAAKGLKSKI